MKNTAFIIIALIIFGVVGFFIGQRFMWRYNVMNRLSGVPFQRNAGRSMKGRMGNWAETGTGNGAGQITKIDGNNITIQRPNGSTSTIILNDNTVINKSVKGVRDDLKTGESIMVFGGGIFGSQTILLSP